MVNVTYKGTVVPVEEGTSLRSFADQYMTQEDADIALVRVNGILCELHKTIRRDCLVEAVTTAHRDGMRTYERSLLLLFCKAVRDVVAREELKKIYVKFSVIRGYYIELRGVAVDAALVTRICERMQEIVQANLPIIKTNRHLDDVMELFRREGLADKERLLRYRRNSRVNLYTIEDYTDYYYGYMLDSTGMLKYFDLQPYEDGLVLLTPTQANPRQVAVFLPQPKLFRVLQESSAWGEAVDLDTVGAINDAIAGGRIREMVLLAEARQEKHIAEIAARIFDSPQKKIVMIAGPSSSGKTSFSHRLSVQLRACGLKPHTIEVDNYFVDREKTPRDENGDYDFEAIEAVDTKQFNEDMTRLLAGERVEIPTFNFKQGRREYKGNYLQMGADDILVIEGIHGLNDAMSYAIAPENKFKIYISALTQTNIDEHNRIPTTDGRLIRRMVRDARTRGASATDTIARWPSVRRGEEKNIFPYQESADAVFNSSLLYEFSVMKSYAEQLLFGIPKEAPEYAEAKRLLKFFDYFLAVDSSAVPQNSLVKEFIGGSVFTG